MYTPSANLYFDNNATTAPDPSVRAAMEPYLIEHFANPSSSCTFARSAALAIERAREQVAGLIGANADEVIFTSGGTESNNAAVHNALFVPRPRRKVVTVATEHVSVLNALAQRGALGLVAEILPVNRSGTLAADALGRAVDDATALVSVMAANNETGVIQPISAMCELAHARGALFHTDAVQAAGKIELRVHDLGADYLSLGAHKIHGPKGIGALYVRSGAPFHPMIAGGDQERGLRAGTENVAAIVGFGRAAELARNHLHEIQSRVRSLRDLFESSTRSALPEVEIAGSGADRLPNTTMLLIRGVASESLLARLDMDGICCSSGSACAAGAHEPSHVLAAMGLPDRAGWGALRVSLSRFTTAPDVDCLVDRLIHHVKVLRNP